ncbi:MAG TPA: HAMP domain-containing sensor histidine kinase [Ktedonobacteraceae bacterium]|jgi:two-component system sensor histidine kinase BaeS|nr:HAMP domain-containing sensor histidine kinase [Ktedonobacteraceae bacterium]
MATPDLHPAATGLRTKLVLSYLAVIVSAILVLSLAVSWAIRSYLTNAQLDNLLYIAPTWAQTFERDFLLAQGNWGIVNSSRIDPSMLAIIYDKSGKQVACFEPRFVHNSCSVSAVKPAIQKALQGTVDKGSIELTDYDGDQTSSLYVSVPLVINHNLIGAMFISEPPFSLNRGFNALMNQINLAIFLAGGVVILVAVLLSLFLTRRLTRPLEALTAAAERMKNGQYTQRVDPPRSQDEIGRLAQTFNDMANTIEADVNELRRQDQVRRDLIANIAHDLATPLTAIQGFSEALADDVISDPAARQETAQRIGREVQRLKRLVADVRQMTQLEAGHAPLDLAPLDMQDLVDETLFVSQPDCEQDGINLRNEIAPGTPMVQADSDRIIQVLLNLLDNARRHTPRGGEIYVGAAPKDRFLHVWVTDTGSGISREDLAHIFERFYRADRSRTGATGGGSGLGLSIVRAIVNTHGGSIWAESTLGQGTRITFTLPLAEQRVPTAVLPA